MAKRKGRRQPPLPPGLIPTPERMEHGDIKRVDHHDPDGSLRLRRGYRAMDTLERYWSAGYVSAAAYSAARAFQEDFATARCAGPPPVDLLRAGDGNGLPPQYGATEAAERVWRALKLLGGQGSPGGSCAWFVLGLQHSLTDWRDAIKPMSGKAAKQTFLGVVDVIRDVYPGGKT